MQLSIAFGASVCVCEGGVQEVSFSLFPYMCSLAYLEHTLEI